MRHADTAMYHAKAQGPGQWRYFSGDLTTQALLRLQLETSLRQALERGEFELWFQPKLAADQWREEGPPASALSGAEALLRWRRDGELVPPARFIPLAEQTGLIVEIGDWVFEAVCRQLALWQSAGLDVPPLAFNLSVRQLASEGLVERIEAAMLHHGVSPQYLQAEVTESAFMSDFDRNMRVLSDLRALGMQVAIDDFGTGYSSLAYLRQLPIDVLKIDRSFVRDLPDEQAIPVSVIQLAKAFGLATVAEGVETVAQAAWLKAHGCDVLQGFLFAKPLPVPEFAAWLAHRQPREQGFARPAAG